MKVLVVGGGAAGLMAAGAALRQGHEVTVLEHMEKPAQKILVTGCLAQRYQMEIVQEMPGCCPLCGGKMVLKKSKRGRSFYGCSNFPECNFMTWNIPVAEQCPQCGSTLFQKGGKSGKLICEKPGCGFEKNLTGGGQA